ncbi:MAG TPA: 50S ribosomal protein L11 methyltransferase [Roseiarcus sp.]|nr:50S ribosomal protein L11 methyltransferase [Roseiarcus sp.]
MLEGLPPNNAAHRLTLVTDEKRARAVADLIVESFEPAEVASAAFETEEPWPGGGKAWAVEAYFGFTPDEDEIRALLAVASDEETARSAAFGVTEKRDWVANALAGLQPVRAGRFLVHGAHDRAGVRTNDVGIEIEAGLAFGTGHHGTTRGCLLHFDRLLKRRRDLLRTGAVLDVGCGAGVLAIAAAKVLRRKVWPGDIDPVAVEVANANARLNSVGELCKAVVSRGVENRLLRDGAPYDVVFANILAKPLRLLAPSLAAVIAPYGEAIVSGLLLADVPGVLSSWRAQGFFLAERIDLEGWASLRLTTFRRKWNSRRTSSLGCGGAAWIAGTSPARTLSTCPGCTELG